MNPFFLIWIDMKDTCDVGVIKEGIKALKEAIEKEGEKEKECPGGSGNISLLFFSKYNMCLSPNKWLEVYWWTNILFKIVTLVMIAFAVAHHHVLGVIVASASAAFVCAGFKIT